MTMERRNPMSEFIKNQNQKDFDDRFGNLIRSVLLKVEMALPETPNDRQWTAVRKELNTVLYDFEREFLEKYVK